MSYRCQLYRSIDEVNAAEWREICRNGPSLFLDPRFLKAVELSFAGESEFWYAVFCNDDGRPVAATCFSRVQADILVVAPGFLRNWAASLRRLWPKLLQFPILVCGLPYTTGDSLLAMAEDIEINQLLAALDETARQIAGTSRCRMIAFQQFSPAQTERMDGLLRHDYLKTRSVFSYRLEGQFRSFDDYLASRKHGSRYTIKKNQRRFAEAGLTAEILSGRDGVDRLLTPDVYRLYLQVFERAERKLDRVPLEFFQEFARQLPDESRFVFIRRGEQIVAFGCGLAGREDVVLMKVGYDESLNRDVDLYFNLVYRMLDMAIQSGARTIHCGATADRFKQRLGCTGEWLSIYFKSASPLRHRLLLRPLFRMTVRNSDDPAPPAG